MTSFLPSLFGREIRSLHCLGVAGMGVGPLAIYLARRGYSVSGSDDGMVDAMRVQLERAGVVITPPGQIPEGCELVVFSSAISPAHPAWRAAQDRGLPLVRRGELLAEVTRDRKLVAVCGSHGKTTTTAMLVCLLRQASFPAGYILGGLFADEAIAPADAGSNDWVVAEIDESDGTIERFSPELTVAVNLDWDHPDRYRRQTEIEDTFAELFRRTRGAVLLSDACALSSRIAGRLADRELLTFGRTGDYAAVVTAETEERQTLSLTGRFPIASASLRALGDFNAANATAALAAAHRMGVSLSAEHLADYPGVRRRQAVLHATGTLTVVEDYAHHPAEIRALLGSLRRRARGRLLAVFQPHRYSRTAQFLGEFAAALAGADRVYLLDVYAAGERPVSGGSTGDLYAQLRATVPTLPVAYTGARSDALLLQLQGELQPGDLVAFVGAGDIERHARVWLADLDEQGRIVSGWDAFAGELTAALSAGARVRREEPLAEKTTMRVGGAARVYVEPANAADVQAILRAAQARALPVHVLGRGSNLIVPDRGVDGVVMSFHQSNWQAFEPQPDGSVRVGAGLRLKNLCGLATRAGLVGFEFLEGIPGNVGGALRMNAGAMGGWMFDVVESVDLVTPDGRSLTLRKEQMHVDYRHCEELETAVALGAVLRPRATSASQEISRQIETYREKRQKTQPREPSAGCIFKNPTGTSAGKVIDEAGLKGLRVGDAEVSPIHANFIVNRGHATSADILELVRRIRARVEAARGIRLEPEVMLYGQAWADVLGTPEP